MMDLRLPTRHQMTCAVLPTPYEGEGTRWLWVAEVSVLLAVYCYPKQRSSLEIETVVTSDLRLLH